MPNQNVIRSVVRTLRTCARTLSAHRLHGMAYDAENPVDRANLAEQLKQKLGAIGFVPSTRRTRDPGRRYGQGGYKGRELVLSFRHRKDPGLLVNIYTSIVEGQDEVRSKGADAIRICTEYETKALREGGEGFSTDNLVFVRALDKDELSSCTVHRRGGSVEDIVDRVVERARSAYKALNLVKRCTRCQAPMALSRQNKEYCTETCWKR